MTLTIDFIERNDYYPEAHERLSSGKIILTCRLARSINVLINEC